MTTFDNAEPRRRHTGIRRMLERVEENSPGLLQLTAQDALRELVDKEGGLRDTLTVTFGANTEIVRPADPQDPARPSGYPVMLQLRFAPATERYEVSPDPMIDALQQQLHASWSHQHRDRYPGAFRAETLPDGTRTITIAHTDYARLTRVLNDVLRQHALPSMDTRLIRLGDARTLCHAGRSY